MAAAVILSTEDVSEQSLLDEMRQITRVLVLTEQAGGCIVFCKDESRRFKAPEVEEINPTGAGDTFAAAYLVRLHQTRGNPWEAAKFANRIAAASVTRETLDGKIEAINNLMDSG
jgi:sugar/nucleoside kinase (ribokinase family)